MHEHVCVYICARVYVYVCMNSQGWHHMSSLLTFDLYILRQGSLLNLEIAVLASLASQLALGIPCPSPV